MPTRQILNKGNVPVRIFTDDVQPDMYDQLEEMSQLDIVHDHISVMPDGHPGAGAVIGSVIPTIDAIIPAAVGVDLGCGMEAVKTTLTANDLPDDLSGVRAAIEDLVPVGFSVHSDQDAPDVSMPFLDDIAKKYPEAMPKDANKAKKQMGTLGGGNHFIEICLDQNDQVWAMLHSGSRGIGKTLADFFITKAKEICEAEGRDLPNSNLAYLRKDDKFFRDYVSTVGWAQDYAANNRQQMMMAVMEAMEKTLPLFHPTGNIVSCHHNYISFSELHYGRNVMVTRKGAIRAGEGEWGIIPGSMGDRSYIVTGKGDRESFHSCAHGAGRRMSRGEAKRTFTTDDLAKQTAGVECRKDDSTLDEAPGAYKPIDEVMENQRDLVDVQYTLKQVLCVKG